MRDAPRVMRITYMRSSRYAPDQCSSTDMPHNLRASLFVISISYTHTWPRFWWDMDAEPLIGIDFSGDAKKWQSNRRNSNIWIAIAAKNGDSLHVKDLHPIQQLAGDAEPFQRLSNYLSQLSSGYAAIDAPFSVPAAYVEDVETLWQSVLALPCEKGRPFAHGADLIGKLAPTFVPKGLKVLRQTESYWQGQGVSTRSTMWNGPRGGTPFAVACMTMLARHHGRIWPFRMNGKSGCVLVEAFPAAQLCHWGIQHTGYNRQSDESADARLTILGRLRAEHDLLIEDRLKRNCESSADALDAVICAYAAAAVAHGQLKTHAAELSSVEGLIAVHR